jgi:anthranilate phosphoribosyltransferase
MASLTPTLKTLLGHRTLTADEAREAFSAMMTGEVSHAETAAVLAVLAMRVPTSEELLGAAHVMREHVTRVPAKTPASEIVDTCGTGGAPKTFNVSTAGAVVAAAAGAKVGKHGNRSRTGRGSAEVLRGLGVNVDAGPELEGACLDTLGLCFCFAVHHHPAIRNVMPVRMALGVPTIFNLLGPLTNPLGAERQVMGVYDSRFLKPMALALKALGTKKAIVLHADDGLDELSISAPTELVHVGPDGLRLERVAPEDFGLRRAPRQSVLARDLEHAVELVQNVLSGSERGAPRDMTLMAAGSALYVADVVPSIAAGVELAAHTIDTGDAQRKLQAWTLASQG